MPDDAAGGGLGARLQRLAHALYVSHGVGQGGSLQMRVVRPRASKLSAHLRYGLPPSCSVAVPAIGHSDSA